jgi:hypothetical protein
VIAGKKKTTENNKLIGVAISDIGPKIELAGSASSLSSRRARSVEPEPQMEKKSYQASKAKTKHKRRVFVEWNFLIKYLFGEKTRRVGWKGEHQASECKHLIKPRKVVLIL